MDILGKGCFEHEKHDMFFLNDLSKQSVVTFSPDSRKMQFSTVCAVEVLLLKLYI